MEHIRPSSKRTGASSHVRETEQTIAGTRISPDALKPGAAIAVVCHGRSSIGGRRAGRGCLLLLFHFLSETERPHVSPYFLDVLQTFLLGTGLAHVFPTKRIGPLRKPYGILLFVVN